MFCDYFLVLILSLPILGCSVFGFYLLSIKKPFLYNTKDETMALVGMIMAVITFFAILKTDNAGLSSSFIAYLMFFIIGISSIFNKDDKYVLHGVDEKVNLIFVYLLRAHKISYQEKLGIVLTVTNTRISINYLKTINSCSISINGENNNTLVKEILQEVVEFYSKKQEKAYKKTAFIFIWSGIIFYIWVTMIGILRFHL